MSRFALRARVLFWEEPLYEHGLDRPEVRMTRCADSGVEVVTPLLRVEDKDHENDRERLVALLDATIGKLQGPVVKWYQTPMMYPFSAHIPAACIVYDCMDELANFRDAPADLTRREAQLLDAADLVFTGGRSLYEAKRRRHRSVHAFSSSIDTSHFARARNAGTEPVDQRDLPSPRLGYFGVVDERIDLPLIAALADADPRRSVVIVGPVAKIANGDLPQRANIHYLGQKDYRELPDYICGWNVAIMPFAINEATRFISPTKTPEYLAAGRPVVSTSIADVVSDYGSCRGVLVGGTHAEFIAACDAALALRPEAWLAQSDATISTTSWAATAAAMGDLIARKVATGTPRPSPARAHARALSAVKDYDALVVGAGFAGSVMAERLATLGNKRVLVIDKRPHIAGNAFDRRDAAGLLIHQYGPHIFHTNSADVFAYLSQFTEWRRYEHRVLADVDGLRVPMPINRTTLNILYRLDLQTDEQAATYLASRAEPVDVVRTSADVVIAAVGRELYETFFQGYTRKQWGMDPSELDKSVTARVPTRTNCDDRYFTDTYQAMPKHGYTAMFARLLDHPNIDVRLDTAFADIAGKVAYRHLVFTGPIDEYFDHCYGRLPYRSLRFEHRTRDVEQFQPVATVNFPAESVPYTRITEYKHLTGETSARTSLTYEFPSAVGDPYYPIPRDENQALFKHYEALAIAERDVTFVGRLATYRYYNMDQVVGQALAAARRLIGRFGADPARVADKGETAEAA